MFVALQLLEPHAGADLMAASDQLQRVSVGERVAEGGLVGSDRTAACGETAATLQGAATDAEATVELPCNENQIGWNGNQRRRDKEKCGARKSCRENVRDVGRENMRFLQAQHLAANVGVLSPIRIGLGRLIVAVVHQVTYSYEILLRKNVVHAQKSEVLANTL